MARPDASFTGSPRAHVRGALGLSAMIALSAAAIPHVGSGEAASLGSDDEAVVGVPPAAAPPLLLRDVDPRSALGINARIPFSREPNPAARPFRIRGDDEARAWALECLTQAIYYEAGAEATDGQRAVAQVVLNRVRHPAFAPSVCAVVYHGSLRATGCQFSFTCDGSMRRRPAAAAWSRAREIAGQALAGAVFEPVGHATHYHADYVVPYWAGSLAKNAMLGTHIFYRWPGWWGRPAAFARSHSGKEADPRLLRMAALRRDPGGPDYAGWSSEDLVLETDPRVELISIIQLLAAESPAGEQATPYEKAVREHFSSYSDHVAVQIYRQLSAGDSDAGSQSWIRTLMHYSRPPELKSREPLQPELVRAGGGTDKLEGFMAALRDFVRHSDFETFFTERKPLYAKLEARARKPALAFVARLERDTGTPVHTVRFILAPLLAGSAAGGCQAVERADPGAWVIVGLRDSPEQPFDKPARLNKSLAALSESECPGRVTRSA